MSDENNGIDQEIYERGKEMIDYADNKRKNNLFSHLVLSESDEHEVKHDDVISRFDDRLKKKFGRGKKRVPVMTFRTAEKHSSDKVHHHVLINIPGKGDFMSIHDYLPRIADAWHDAQGIPRKDEPLEQDVPEDPEKPVSGLVHFMTKKNGKKKLAEIYVRRNDPDYVEKKEEVLGVLRYMSKEYSKDDLPKGMQRYNGSRIPKGKDEKK